MVYYAELNIISVLLCMIIQQKEVKDKQEIFLSKSFRHILWIVEFIIILDTLSLLIQNNLIAHNYWMHLMIMNGYFILQALFPMELLIFCIDSNKFRYRRVRILTYLPFVLSVICVIINSIKPFAYHIVENDKYERMSSCGFIVINIWPIIYAFFGTIIVIRNYMFSNGKKRETYGHIIVFGIFAFVSAVAAFFFKGFTVWPFISLDLIYLYLNVLSKNNHKLDVLAFKDSLTGIGNVASYESVTAHLFEEIENGNAEFGLVVMDANGLKFINDTFGHEAGNKYIKSAAMYICNIFKHSPVFRIGGDEFIAILEKDDYKNRDSLIMEFDSKLHDEFIMVGGEKVHLSIARGIALYKKGMSYSEVFYLADSQMYLNKAETKKKNKIPSRS